MECKVLYTGEKPGIIRLSIISYLINKDFNKFKEKFIQGDFSKIMRLDLHPSDELESIKRAITLFYEHFNIISSQLKIERKKDIPIINDLINKVKGELHIDVDKTQSTSIDSFDDSKNKEEVIDKNRNNLNKHIIDIYGNESEILINKIKNEFYDLIIDNAYYDNKLEKIVPQNNNTLNKNFLKLKNNKKDIIKAYLISKNIPFMDNTFSILNTFYKHIKSIQNFENELSSLLDVDIISKKNKQFKELLNELLKDNTFNNGISFYLNNHIMEDAMYSGDVYSFSYLAVRNYILANKPNLKHKLNELESSEINLLEATKAYTMLQHFDELLIDSVGNQIAIQKGTFNIDVNNKYSYHQDTSHERLGWLTTEYVGSEKHTSQFTKAVLNRIRIYDHITDKYQNKRLSPTSLVLSARHLINDIAYNRIKIMGGEDYVKKCGDIIKNDIITFHQNPSAKLREILQLLFDKTPGLNDKPMYIFLTNKSELTELDLDILYSVYLKVFDEHNKNSFINQQNDEHIKNHKIPNLVKEVACYVQNNIIMDYIETDFDSESGGVEVKVKKKYFTNSLLFDYFTQLNAHINDIDIKTRKKLQKEYGFKKTPDSSNINYEVSINGTQINLLISNSNDAQILVSNSKNSTYKFNNKELFKMLDEINLIEFAKNFKSKNLSKDQQILKNILEFIDSFLELNILSEQGIQILLTYKTGYKSINNMNCYLMPLVQLAMRASYINSQYINAYDENLSLSEYLKEDNIFKYYKKFPKSKLFTEMYNEVSYVLASYKDDVLEQWADATFIFTGDNLKSTTKDFEGNGLPNNGVNKLGGNIHYYLNKLHEYFEENASRSLLFANDSNSIKGTLHDLECTSKFDITKSVKNMTAPELFFHSLFNKFWGSYLKSDSSIIVLPTAYSDKTTFINYEIKSNLLDDDNYVDVVLNLYVNTIGAFYETSFNNTKNKLNALTNYYNLKHGTNYNYRELLANNSEESLLEIVDEFNKQSPNKIELELDKDYRERKKTIIKIVEEILPDGSIIKKEIKQLVKYCHINEILEYSAKLYNDKKLLSEFLNKQKHIFINEILKNNINLQVLDFKDNFDYYTSKEINERASSKNPIINTILKLYSTPDQRKWFFENWIDKKSGKLILAKNQYEIIDGENISYKNTPILNSVDYDKNSKIILNPLLDKFFYIEPLYSNNLRLSLTGSETNHPDKSKNKDVLFYVAKNTTDFTSFKILLGNLDISIEEFEQNIEILNNCDNVSDLFEYAYGNVTNPIAKYIYDESILTIINIAQGTQFKRNVIIPATLEYCTINEAEGIPPVTKVAVIKDWQASVYNYKGNTKDIDSADGAAKITPFLSIMENLSLGSQAVGFIKKPIWHSYDTNNGTAFLAKFATNTMTNEEMKLSLHSKNNLFNLFRQMTNLQWEEKIDLTKSIRLKKNMIHTEQGKSLHETWFNNVILENNKLFYENKFGEIIQIQLLSKDPEQSEDIYYTLEKNNFKKNKVYHLFTGPESTHHTFNFYEEALEFKLKNNAHTINSLFELQTALGGINCVDENGEISEFNNKVVVNFMNNIGLKLENLNDNYHKTSINQENYYQPLKKYHIGYALNSTAVKNGAKNINPEEAWEGNKKLRYFEVDSAGLGMQMNADHDIINSEMTEFSQVIAATSAYGYTYDHCNEIFEALAQTAFEASKEILDSVNKFLNKLSPTAQSDLYDSLGRIILVSQSIRTKENLTNIIKEAILKVFNKNSNHADDVLKLPFSDSNIYSEFVSTLASTITKASIKRKHPGSGCVLVPGYDIATYFEISGQKYLYHDVLKLSRKYLKYNIIEELLKTSDEDIDDLNDMSLELLLQTSQQYKYLLEIKDITQFNKNIVNLYLSDMQKQAPYKDISYFLPEDVVIVKIPMVDELGFEITDEFGNTVYTENTIILNSMKKYIEFKETSYPKGTLFLLDVVTPRNLKPSLLRWKYINLDNQEVYMNIFDHPIIRKSFEKNGKLNSAERNEIQVLLNNINDGFFIMNGVKFDIIEGSLENTEAELIMSNIYKDVFGVENESLSEILDKGEDYFINKINKDIHAPSSLYYDVALLKDNGKHSLISFNEIQSDEYCSENNFLEISIKDDTDIYCVKGNKVLFKIGEYKNLSKEEDDDLYVDNDKIISKSGKKIDENYYKINKLGKIQKRIDFVKKYDLIHKTLNSETNEFYHTAYPLYVISNRNELSKYYSDSEINKIYENIVSDIYSQDNYKFIELNSLKGEQYHKNYDSVKKYFNKFLNNSENDIFKSDNNFNINEDHRNYINIQLNLILKNSLFNSDVLEKLKIDFYKKEAHKKMVSFQDSLKFIASRIPAQTLQSFMTMKNIGWTRNSNNMAYVSHFQIYLQGSDYDIDKVYIMGQSYDNGIYVNWSPLFDYYSEKTLSLSKLLPFPRNIKLTKSESGVDITEELDILLKNYDNDLNIDSETSRIIILKTFTKLLNKINNNNGEYKYNNIESEKLNKILKLIKDHNYYKIPEFIKESAYKNIAASNIYSVSHDIRNRDQCYTAIAMDILSASADNSPKGKQTATLNMLSPLTKYIMQYLNLVGKNVIGIAANGEKFWFNYYYYWSKCLKTGNVKYLKFYTEFSRIEGRYKKSIKNLSELIPKTTKIIPDLNKYDEELKQVLLQEFGVDLSKEEYVYVDQLISQLLSAATDNAKELILAKINSGSNFARMYVYLIINGYNLDDIVSFMTSPVAEFIDNQATQNMFLEMDLHNSPNSAINNTLGYVNSEKFLHGNYSVYEYDEELEQNIKTYYSKKNYIKNILLNSHLFKEVLKTILENKEIFNLTEFKKEDLDLNVIMQGYILTLANPNLKLNSKFLTNINNQNDSEINNYLLYCQNLINNLQSVSLNYENFEEMLKDVKEFKKIYKVSSEMSNIASSWLKLNQGIPTGELDLLDLLHKMSNVIFDNERYLNIKESEIFTNETSSEEIKKKTLEKYDKVIENILNNNKSLHREEVTAILEMAHEKNLINNFDIYKYLTDEEYKRNMIEYNRILYGCANVLHMMEVIPTCKQNLESLKGVLVSKNTASVKSRLIDKLRNTSKKSKLNKQLLQNTINYVDNLNIINFVRTLDPIILPKDIVGFNQYFEKTDINVINLSTFEGMASLKHWIEHEFLLDLRDGVAVYGNVPEEKLKIIKSNYENNPLILHLCKFIKNGKKILTVDIDFSNFESTLITQKSYNEIIKGMQMLENVPYYDTGYTVADLLQLYNLLINQNKIGSKNLTTSFKMCHKLDNILNKYFNFTGSLDFFNLDVENIINLDDYYINSAPVITEYLEKISKDKFIKVKDPVQGYVIKKYNEKHNIYKIYNDIIPFKTKNEKEEEKLSRLKNFSEYCPFVMPNINMAVSASKIIEKSNLNDIEALLSDFFKTGKIIILKNC